MFLAPALRRFCQFSRNALAPEGRFDIKILIYARVCAGERRVVCSNAAHAYGAIAAFGDKKRDAPLFDGLLKPFLLGTCKHVFADLTFEAIFQLPQLPVIRVLQNLHGKRHRICRRQEHQRFSPLVSAVFNETDAFPEPEAAFIPAVVQLRIARAAHLCPA